MYAIGAKIAHPMHGAGIVHDIIQEKVNGVTRQYYVMNTAANSMLVMIPVASSDEIGVRAILSEKEIDSILKDLPKIETEDVQNWNRRYRENMLRIKSGDLKEVAKVIKNLIVREKERGLSTGERKMLNSAKQIFISEVVLIKNKTYEEIEQLLYKSV